MGIDFKRTETETSKSMLTDPQKETERQPKMGVVSSELARSMLRSNVASNAEVQDDARSVNCLTQISCDDAKYSPYRSINGSCNNLNHPNWGTIFSPQPRYQPAQYDDGVNSPRTTGIDGSTFPSPRLISNKLFRAPGDCTETDHARTLMVMAWGQFTDHDISSTLPTLGTREQITDITSLIDGGSVYGNTYEQMEKLWDKNTDHLFENADGGAFDLASLNLQRGRDHGLPPYNSWRQWCGLPVGTSFSDLPDISKEKKAVFADLYRNVDDIDVFAGGVSEIPLDGAAVGPLFSCIIGNQFRDLKDGDRYW
uniref:Uncharacterized protein n=1 Tax=Magallana gigas TaxID=29159 RepID=A0A8W8MH94_MAGGI